MLNMIQNIRYTQHMSQSRIKSNIILEVNYCTSYEIWHFFQHLETLLSLTYKFAWPFYR